MESIAWEERFDVGVPLIDNAHQRLFSIVSRIISMCEDSQKGKFACVEGIKYLKNYTIQHFAQEEAYMRSIHYAGYQMHSRLHASLRDQLLPALERELLEQDYSPSSVKHFVGECAGWLIGHIMIVDHGITGQFQLQSPGNLPELPAIQSVLGQLVQEVFGQSASCTQERFTGSGIGRAVYYQLSCENTRHGPLTMVMGIEDRLAFHAAGSMSGLHFFEFDELFLAIIREILHLLIYQLGQSLYFLDALPPKILGEEFISLQQAAQLLSGPQSQGLILETPVGRIAVGILHD